MSRSSKGVDFSIASGSSLARNALKALVSGGTSLNTGLRLNSAAPKLFLSIITPLPFLISDNVPCPLLDHLERSRFWGEFGKFLVLVIADSPPSTHPTSQMINLKYDYIFLQRNLNERT